MGRQMDEDQSPSGFGLFAVSCRFVLVDSRLSSPSKAPRGGSVIKNAKTAAHTDRDRMARFCGELISFFFVVNSTCRVCC